eukprot:NODE_1758_length_1416_cov_24.426481_g1587_i0.p1 GENE.NODE_1758_length_1416_cov_24.426481_g1587_i0~~NODE_1758_length_1416_cov_24.426481_g1587_i0.p1  ORF type:complete len:430 (+),score=131.81 NODE_1758_length_1416_cov_24.426481_g1587_i0:63-1292(+)
MALSFLMPLCLLLVHAATAEVLTLKSSNFKSETEASPAMLVEFYAPWCGHCQSLEPEYKKAAKILEKEAPHLSLAKVDATVEEKLAQDYDVSGFPTLKLFKNGEFIKDYQGKRTAQAIADWMVRQDSDAGADDDAEGNDEDYDAEGADKDYPDEEMPSEEGEEAGEPEKEAIGVVSLDVFTFDKLVGAKHFDVLVKFDMPYAYGDKEKEFADFTHRVANNSDAKQFLIGVVGVQDYGEKENADLAERFGVSADNFPVFKLFTKSGEQIDFDSAVTSDSLAAFVSEHLGIWIGKEGCIEAFDLLARGFALLNEAQKQEKINAMQSEIEKFEADDEQKPRAAYYHRMAQRILKSGNDFPQHEYDRITRLLDSKITDEKKAEMAVRLNILMSFGAKRMEPAKPIDAEDIMDE